MTSVLPDDGKSSISVDVGAKAEAKLEVKTEIPAESSGRLLDALTDIIRPFTEKRGLRADMLRLQREDVLIGIAHKAAERARIENVRLNPVPTKFLVPFLERSSTEDIKSELVDRWADLLVSASQNYNDRFVLYTNLLSMIGAQDVEFLSGMVNSSRYVPKEGEHTHYQDAPYDFSLDELVRDLRAVFDPDYGRAKIDDVSTVVTKHERPGMYIRCVEFQDENDKTRDLSKFGDRFPHHERHSVNALKTLGMVDHHMHHDDYFFIVDALVLSELGVDFYEACTPPKPHKTN